VAAHYRLLTRGAAPIQRESDGAFLVRR